MISAKKNCSIWFAGTHVAEKWEQGRTYKVELIRKDPEEGLTVQSKHDDEIGAQRAPHKHMVEHCPEAGIENNLQTQTCKQNKKNKPPENSRCSQLICHSWTINCYTTLSLPLPCISLYFASKMGNRCSDVLKHVKYIRQKQRPVATDFLYYYSSKEIGLLQPFFSLLPFLKISFLTPVLPLKTFLMMNTGSIEGADIFLRSCVFDGFCFLKAVTFRLYCSRYLIFYPLHLLPTFLNFF